MTRHATARRGLVLAALMRKFQPEGGFVPIAHDHPLYEKAIAGILVVAVPLAEIEDLPEFQDFDLISNPELCVMEVSPEIWSRLLELSAAALAYSTQEDQE